MNQVKKNKLNRDLDVGAWWDMKKRKHFCIFDSLQYNPCFYKFLKLRGTYESETVVLIADF